MKTSSVLALAIAAATAHAAEVTVTAKPFRIEKSFTATLLPAKSIAVAVDPAVWPEYEILEIKAHGAAVKKGEVVVRFDREAFDRKVADLRRSVDAQTLAMASRELAFSKLEDETKLKLESAQRAARVAAEDLDYFNKIDLKADQEQAKDALETSAQRLAGEKEEMTQLKKMYEADEVTEETEEIVLKRQAFAVKSAELHYHLAELATKYKLETTLPRQLESYQAADRTAKIALEKATQDLPRGLLQAKVELEGARTALERDRADLAKLEGDAKWMTFTAPADGIFYYGSMEDGRWSIGDLARLLVKGGKVPAVKPFAAVVPGQPTLGLEAALDEATVRSLSKGLKGSASVSGREDLPLSATVRTVAAVPGTDGRYRVQLDPEVEGRKPSEFPPDFNAAAGMTMECRFVVYEKEAAVVLPMNALRPGPGGSWVVDVKLAEGKTEARPVKRGRVSGSMIEIAAGVDPGQVVTLPD